MLIKSLKKIFDFVNLTKFLLIQTLFLYRQRNLFCSVPTEHFFQKFRNIGTFSNVPGNILKIIERMRIAKLCSDWGKK